MQGGSEARQTLNLSLYQMPVLRAISPQVKLYPSPVESALSPLSRWVAQAIFEILSCNRHTPRLALHPERLGNGLLLYHKISVLSRATVLVITQKSFCQAKRASKWRLQPDFGLGKTA